ncbi:MAG: InlB B-repeat-containing protein [Ruminococcus flavefaciens]|nr:InlB B-repeat-containing protein [Ruminococcus flavefaciens]
MKKKILLALLAIAACFACTFALAACGDVDGDAVENTGNTNTDTVGGSDNDITETPAHTHSYTAIKTFATCTEQGYTVHTCACGYSYTDAYTNALGHNFENYVSDDNATCTQNCTESSTCSRCAAATDTREVPNSALGHDVRYIGNYPATCTQNRFDIFACTRCTVTETREIPDSAHGHYFINYISDNNATCTGNETETSTCFRCTITDTREVTGSALGHNFANYVSNHNATCTSNSTETSTCSRCTTSDTREITGSALGHNFANYISNHNATCTVNGTETSTCSRCTTTDTRTETNSALGHNYVNYVSDGNATCTADGTETSACSRCTQTNTRTEANSALGHNLEHHNGKSATCTENGWQPYDNCRRCNYTTYNEITSTGHNYITENNIPTNNENAGTLSGFYCLNCYEFTSKAIAGNGYTFLGWYNNQQLISEEPIFTYIMDAEKTVYSAQWTYYTLTVIRGDGTNSERCVTVSFNYNDGTELVEKQLVTETSNLKYPTVPTRDGYAFRGWYTDISETELFDFSENLNDNITLYAGWQAMADSGYSQRIYWDINNMYNSENRAFNQTISKYDYYYYYFTALTDCTYTIHYYNKSTASAYEIYTYIYNETQQKVIKEESLTGSLKVGLNTKDYLTATCTANAGDVLYFRVKRQNYTKWTPEFYCYIEGAQIPEAGGVLEEVLEYNEKKITATQSVTLVADYYDGYTFLGWYEDDKLISDKPIYTFDMPKKNIVYKAKYSNI